MYPGKSPWTYGSRFRGLRVFKLKIMIEVINHIWFWEAKKEGISLYCFTLSDLTGQLSKYWGIDMDFTFSLN